ncbi:hypothetical protein EVAR_97438_1 [Eumeta japonica]|uniref:Uncharacterized protein n=1 Tax=Eumeta variegata TaxID=151549 RepID=A0A4C1X126_EUMVA|nr:hypothetical protein EVAR_97438_1 [Eumeta japonica]
MSTLEVFQRTIDWRRSRHAISRQERQRARRATPSSRGFISAPASGGILMTHREPSAHRPALTAASFAKTVVSLKVDMIGRPRWAGPGWQTPPRLYDQYDTVIFYDSVILSIQRPRKSEVSQSREIGTPQYQLLPYDCIIRLAPRSVDDPVPNIRSVRLVDFTTKCRMFMAYTNDSYETQNFSRCCPHVAYTTGSALKNDGTLFLPLNSAIVPLAGNTIIANLNGRRSTNSRFMRYFLRRIVKLSGDLPSAVFPISYDEKRAYTFLNGRLTNKLPWFCECQWTAVIACALIARLNVQGYCQTLEINHGQKASQDNSNKLEQG